MSRNTMKTAALSSVFTLLVACSFPGHSEEKKVTDIKKSWAHCQDDIQDKEEQMDCFEEVMKITEVPKDKERSRDASSIGKLILLQMYDALPR